MTLFMNPNYFCTLRNGDAALVSVHRNYWEYIEAKHQEYKWILPWARKGVDMVEAFLYKIVMTDTLEITTISLLYF